MLRALSSTFWGVLLAPTTSQTARSLSSRRKSDQTVVASICALIRSVADDLNGDLQILVTDHATFHGEPWFDDALVEKRRHGRGLIPDEWTS